MMHTKFRCGLAAAAAVLALGMSGATSSEAAPLGGIALETAAGPETLAQGVHWGRRYYRPYYYYGGYYEPWYYRRYYYKPYYYKPYSYYGYGPRYYYYPGPRHYRYWW